MVIFMLILAIVLGAIAIWAGTRIVRGGHVNTARARRAGRTRRMVYPHPLSLTRSHKYT